MRTIINKNNMGAHIGRETVVLQVIEVPHQDIIFCQKSTDPCRRTLHSFQQGQRFLSALPSLHDIIITMMIIISIIILTKIIIMIIIKIIRIMTIIIMIITIVIILILMTIIVIQQQYSKNDDSKNKTNNNRVVIMSLMLCFTYRDLQCFEIDLF